MNQIPTYYVASVYGACSYGSSTEQNGQGCATTTTTTSGGSSALTDTGIAVAAIVTLAAVILLVAMVVRIWKRPRKNPAQH